jgi:molybdopterin synthase catalytic subunit
MIDLVRQRIDPALLEAAVSDGSAGAFCVFHGVTRNQHLGRAVTHLEYEAYPEMALPALRDIAAEVAERWPGARVAMVHRLGRVQVGEASVVIAVSTPHRAEAFEACRHAIDSLKTRVPIWKKEFWADGSAWVEGTPLTDPPPGT